MAKWQVKKVQELLFEIVVPKFDEFETKVNRVTKESMLDPESLEGVLFCIRDLSTRIQNLNSQLFLAYNNPSEFVSLINSTKIMLKELVKVRESLDENSPGDERRGLYVKKENEAKILLIELKEVKKVLDFPNRKRKYRRAIENSRSGVYDYHHFKRFDEFDTLILAGEKALEGLL